MQKLTINNPEEIELQIHQYLKGSTEARFVHRIHGLLLLLNNEENNCANIAGLFKNSPRSLSNWVHNVNNSGNIGVLRDKPRKGRTSRLDESHLAHIKTVLQAHPSEVGLSANIWDGETLSYYIEKEFSVSLQVRQCQRLFRKLGFSLKRARPTVAKGDPEKKEQAKRTSRR